MVQRACRGLLVKNDGIALPVAKDRMVDDRATAPVRDTGDTLAENGVRHVIDEAVHLRLLSNLFAV